MTPDLVKRPRSTAEAAQAWALLLTRQPSVTGSADEALFAPWLAARLNGWFGPRAEVWTEPVREGDSRQNVFMLLRGRGTRTLVLTGHFDTVATDDYAELKPLATEPEQLLPALLARLEAKSPRTPAEDRALNDLRSGDYLPGRGLLDMKAGLAAGLAVCERFAAEPAPRGNLLFLAVPDEEANSAGARAAAAALAAIAAERRIELVAAINLDSAADDGDGGKGRIVTLGTTGKLLPTAFVAGVPTHAGYPLNGINAGALAAAIAARVEWAAELTDAGPNAPNTPPSLLSLHDGKRGYDVTTPRTAFATFNVLMSGMTPDAVLDRFEALCREAAADWLARLVERAGAAGSQIDRRATVPVLRFEAVAAAARERDSVAAAAAAADLPENLTLPERCWAVTERLWALSGLAAPAIVTGFGSTPYLPVTLSNKAAARRLDEAARAAARAWAGRHGASIRIVPVFAGISDMSFLGEGDASALDLVLRNTSAFALAEGASPVAVAGVPIVNAGPWGRDYHTPLERLETRYAFEVLPDLLAAIAEDVLSA